MILADFCLPRVARHAGFLSLGFCEECGLDHHRGLLQPSSSERRDLFTFTSQQTTPNILVNLYHVLFISTLLTTFFHPLRKLFFQIFIIGICERWDWVIITESSRPLSQDNVIYTYFMPHQITPNVPTGPSILTSSLLVRLALHKLNGYGQEASSEPRRG